MKTARKSNALILFAILIGLFMVSQDSLSNAATLKDRLLNNFKTMEKPPEPLLPASVKIAPGFEVGKGYSVGNVQMVQGDVVVVHKGESSAFKLTENAPIFNGDLLVSMKDSRANIKLSDKSVFAIAPYTKLLVDKVVFDPAKNKRMTNMSLDFGRARFIAQKLSAGSKFNVKTPTAVAGVRGSDFGLSVTTGELPKGSCSILRFLSYLTLVNEAHAALPGLTTTLVTGPATNVSFAGPVGAAKTVTAYSVSGVSAGQMAMSPIYVGPMASAGALTAAGANLASVDMPAGMK